MKIQIKGRGVKITQPMKDYAQKKLPKLLDYFGNITQIDLDMEVKKIKNKDLAHIAVVNIYLPKQVVLRGEVKSKDMYASIDLIVEKMTTPLKKYQDRYKDKRQASGFFSKVKRKVTNDYEELVPGMKILKEKKENFKPMDPIEAVLQLSKIKKDFFIFNNSKSHHTFSVVYDRKNGTYGLLTNKKLYMKRARIKGFKEMPADQKYEGKGVKITKIRDVNDKELTPNEAAGKLFDKNFSTFMTFRNVVTGQMNLVYKKKDNTIGWLEQDI